MTTERSDTGRLKMTERPPARLLNELRARGLDTKTLRQICEHFITERAQADVLAARNFSSAARNASAILRPARQSDQTTRRLNGMLAVAIRLRECPNNQMVGGVIL